MEKKDFVKLNRETYNKIANLFHATRQYLWDDILSFKLYLRDDMAVLDVGCGTGRLYQLLADFQAVEYIGLDQSEEQLKNAQKTFPQNHYLAAEMTSLPLADKKFDVVFCVAALHHLPDKKTRLKALREMKRVLKNGGVLLMTNWNLNSASAKKTIAKGKWFQIEGKGVIVPWLSPSGKKVGERFYHAFTLDELRNLLEKAGFEVEKNYYSKKGEKSSVDKSENIVTVGRC